MVPFRGIGTSFEPSVIEAGEVGRSPAVVVRARVSPAVVESIDSCLGGNAGGLGRGASVESIKAIGLSATPSSPFGRTEYGGGAACPDLPRGGNGGGAFESAILDFSQELSSCTTLSTVALR